MKKQSFRIYYKNGINMAFIRYSIHDAFRDGMIDNVYDKENNPIISIETEKGITYLVDKNGNLKKI